MPINDFLPFGAAAGSDATSQSDYASPSVSPWRTDGFRSGILTHYQLNKVLRQSSMIASAVAAAVSSLSGADVVDDGDYATLASQVAGVIGTPTLTSTLMPGSAPAVAVGSAGALTGTYYYQVAYRTAAGTTEAGLPSAGVAVTAQRVNVSAIPVSADPKVIARDIYRTKAGSVDSILGYYVGTISNNTATTFTDNVADGSLGAPVPKANETGAFIKLNGAPVMRVGPTGTSLGMNAAPSITGYAITALGTNAGRENVNGYRWVAVGMDAMEHNLTGARGVAVGVHAHGASTAADDFVAVGYGVLQSCSVSYNTGIGSLVLSETTTGTNNFGGGAFALQLNTTGQSLTGLGSNTLHSLISGTGDTAVGAFSSYFLQSGDFNMLGGYQAGYNQLDGNGNAGWGALVLWSNVHGQGNVALGTGAGYWETGDNHLWIDNQTRANLAAARTLALLYGTYAVTAADQQLTVNGLLYPAIGIAFVPPARVTAAYTMLAADSIIAVQGTASVPLTLLSGPVNVGRIVTVNNYAAFTVVSASSNVVPLGGGAAATAILGAAAGKWADLQLQTDGVTWQVIRAN